MTVVGRVKRGYAILAALLLVTAGLYVARYALVDRPNAADRETELRLTAVGQTVPTAVAVYSAWIDKGLLYGGMVSGAPTVLDDDAAAAQQALAAMRGRFEGPTARRLTALQTTFSRFHEVAKSAFDLERGGNMDRARVLAAGQLSALTEQVLSETAAYRQAAGAALSTSRSGRDTASTTINLGLLTVFVAAALASVVMVVRIPRDIAGRVHGAVGDLEQATAQVSAISSQLASSASQTAAAISEAATTVDEVRHTSLLASQKSEELSARSTETEEVADAGRRALAEIVGDMNEIQTQVDVVGQSIVRLSEQTAGIADLTTTSNDIAEQSNLLAVNAAIEAAKSAEEGKGFAVVAEEIKSLALQSKDAVRQVRTLLADIVSASTGAVDAAERSGAAIDRSVERVAGSSRAIETLAESVEMGAQSSLQIAASSRQQLVGMDQIGQSMASINDASSHNALAAREMAAEMARLQAVAAGLRSMIGASSEDVAGGAEGAADAAPSAPPDPGLAADEAPEPAAPETAGEPDPSPAL